MSDFVPRRAGWLARFPIRVPAPTFSRPGFSTSAAAARSAAAATLGRGKSFLRKFLRGCVKPAALVVGLCGAFLVGAVSFLYMLAPHWYAFGLRAEAPRGGRAVCFLICVLSAYVDCLTVQALESWWNRLFGSPPAADFRPWWRRAARTAADLYAVSFYVMVGTLGALMLARSVIDPAFMPAAQVVVSHAVVYLKMALGLVAYEMGRLPPLLSLAAVLLFLSYGPYAFIRYALLSD
jgi:hypothetical protein